MTSSQKLDRPGPKASAEAEPARDLPAQRREEARLLEQLRRGDGAAFDEFARRYFPGLIRFALGRLRGDEDLARDIVQTTACKVLKNLSSFRGDSGIFTWLCSCCLNEIRMHFRAASRRPALVEIDANEVVELETQRREDSPFHMTAREEQRVVVHQALDALPEHYARALEMKYLRQASVKEIAQHLGIGDKAAESVLTRARGAFRKLYESIGIVDPPARVSTGSARTMGIEG